MLIKLQKKTVIISQVIGYCFTLIFGVTIILVTSQFYFDIKPLLSQQTGVFKNNAAIINKNISIFNSYDKKGIYFKNKEIKDLKKQTFVKKISYFNSASFEIKMSHPLFRTDLFFESIPDIYLDVETDEWVWDESTDFVPIIVPESYLNLYNFGFAQSQGLPVISKNVIMELEFDVEISGNGKRKTFDSRIVGFSSKLNSILVPQEFLLWANKKFGKSNINSKTSRILIEFNDPSDKNILKYFNENSYSINEEKLEFSKLAYFFKSSLLFVAIVAVVIIFLSIAFVVLSFNLIIQRNKELLLNLYNIGYRDKKIAKFYQFLIGGITSFSIILSVIISNILKNYYREKTSTLFDFEFGANYIVFIGLPMAFFLVIVYNRLIIKNIKKIVSTTN